MVSTSWSAVPSEGTQRSCFAAKLDSVKRALDVWSAGLSSSPKKQADRCLHWIRWTDSAEELRPLTSPGSALRVELKLRYEELCLQEEMKWRQRARIQWLKEGDANTKFFHLAANARRKKNFIGRLSDGHNFFTDHNSKAEWLFPFFSKHLGTDPGYLRLIDLHLLYEGDSSNSSYLQDLHAPFSVQEVRSAVFSCTPG